MLRGSKLCVVTKTISCRDISNNKHINEIRYISNVYLNGAEVLRPDFCGK